MSRARAIRDDSIIEEVAKVNVDYLAHSWKDEELWATRKHICQMNKDSHVRHRFENALWRTWFASTRQTIPMPAAFISWQVPIPFPSYLVVKILTWYRDKDSDITWLYGPLVPSGSPSPTLNEISLTQASRKPSWKRKPSIWEITDFPATSGGSTNGKSLLGRFWSVAIHSVPSIILNPHLSWNKRRKCRVRFEEEVQQCQYAGDGTDVAHVNKAMEKLRQQIAQAGMGADNYGKRKRSNGSVARKGANPRPAKITKHTRTWCAGSQNGPGKMPLEALLHAKLALMQDMSTSTRSVSVVGLRGEDQDDPDLYSVMLPESLDFVEREDSSRLRSSLNCAPLHAVSPTRSSISMSSPCLPTNMQSIACFYIRFIGNDRLSDDYYRAVYLTERTVRDLMEKISMKQRIDPQRIVRVLHVKQNGLKLMVDDDLRELPDGQDNCRSVRSIVIWKGRSYETRKSQSSPRGQIKLLILPAHRYAALFVFFCHPQVFSFD
ncbi:hypothetical protein BDQ94DRAFT_176304 [Aspergillus welwitschiae]|uniref:GRHL1/CP2 C-terminal domain-containing protein n=1 Tax=Aspergillus welwitschiae TaxID=1341132 RepID=A0A3F3PI19_9EURO|nr:hypothetical protein BDQ94DRAFT_176304 [Aspergillus welwitschiae]RDH26548.1 hypothetical protein BDQ94DRAFT_176304 [Aspergillus welwitschiae]